MSVFRPNRAQFPVEELWKYAGMWVAFSLDGRSILSSCPDIARLEQQLVEAGVDPQDVVFEFVPEEDTWLGGAALS
jgi:hypothetical protein